MRTHPNVCVGSGFPAAEFAARPFVSDCSRRWQVSTWFATSIIYQPFQAGVTSGVFLAACLPGGGQERIRLPPKTPLQKQNYAATRPLMQKISRTNSVAPQS